MVAVGDFRLANETDLAYCRVDIGADDHLTLNCCHVTFSVDASPEVLRAMYAGRVSPTGLPSLSGGSMDDSSDRSHRARLCRNPVIRVPVALSETLQSPGRTAGPYFL